MVNMIRNSAIVLLTVAAIGLVWVIAYSPANDPVATDSQADTLSWDNDDPQFYKVSFDSSMQMSSGAGNNDFQVTIRSGLVMSVLSAGSQDTRVGFKLSNLSFRISGQSDPEMNRFLQKPFRVTFSRSGVPLQFEFSEGLNEQEQTILENLIRTFTVSISGDKNSWTSQESVASGTYKASYERTDSGTFEKSKSHFEAANASPMFNGAEIASTELIELYSGQNWLSRMTIDETLESKSTSGPSIRVHNRASIKLSSGNTFSVTKDQWNFAAAEPEQSAPDAESKKVKMSVEEARRSLKTKIAILDSTEQGRSTVIHELKDLLRVDGSIPQFLLLQMQTGEITDRTRADLYLALELAATTEAQAALTDVVTQPDWSTRDSMRALVALAGITDPSPQTLTVLWDTAHAQRGQISTTATYSLGSVGSRMKATDNPEYLTLRDSLLNQAFSAGDTNERVTFIHSLGNTRDAEIAPEIGTFLQDSDPSVRRAAALSLGLMQSTYSTESLVAQFDKESDSQVRGAIAQSLKHLPIADSAPVMESMNRAIVSERDESARYAMANFLASNLDKHPDYKADLKQLMREEPSKRIRQAIGEALAKQ
ncbi:MAG: HEAT repeat domain-containing protein [Pseudomonadota bacterium]